VHRTGQSPIGQHRRVDAPHDRAQVTQRGRRDGTGLRQELHRRLRVPHHQLLGEAEAHAERHQTGLRPVVQVALDATQLGGRVVDRLGAGRRHLRDPALEHRAGRSEHRLVEPGPATDQQRDEPPPQSEGHEHAQPLQESLPLGVDRQHPVVVLQHAGGGDPEQEREERVPEDGQAEPQSGPRERPPDRHRHERPREVAPPGGIGGPGLQQRPRRADGARGVGRLDRDAQHPPGQPPVQGGQVLVEGHEQEQQEQARADHDHPEGRGHDAQQDQRERCQQHVHHADARQREPAAQPADEGLAVLGSRERGGGGGGHGTSLSDRGLVPSSPSQGPRTVGLGPPHDGFQPHRAERAGWRGWRHLNRLS
jgi:hypothetical protein